MFTRTKLLLASGLLMICSTSTVAAATFNLTGAPAYDLENKGFTDWGLDGLPDTFSATPAGSLGAGLRRANPNLVDKRDQKTIGFLKMKLDRLGPSVSAVSEAFLSFEVTDSLSASLHAGNTVINYYGQRLIGQNPLFISSQNDVASTNKQLLGSFAVSQGLLFEKTTLDITNYVNSVLPFDNSTGVAIRFEIGSSLSDIPDTNGAGWAYTITDPVLFGRTGQAPSPVPLPASALFLVASSAGFFTMRRKR